MPAKNKKQQGLFDKADALMGSNIGKKPIYLKHAKLKRSGESLYRSRCPKCKLGTLLMRRDATTFALSAKDNCLLCGQAVVYTDLEELKRKGKLI
jgi:hypothetical protein